LRTERAGYFEPFDGKSAVAPIAPVDDRIAREDDVDIAATEMMVSQHDGAESSQGTRFVENLNDSGFLGEVGAKCRLIGVVVRGVNSEHALHIRSGEFRAPHALRREAR
jgi:hypothetical protein